MSVSLSGAEPIKLKILYAGNPGSDRTIEFESFLKEHFSEVAVTDTSKFIESEVDNFDVVIFDWTRTFDETGRLRSELRIQNPPGLSQEFSRPAVLIGETGGRVTSELTLKLDWLCLCLFDSAHQLKLNHEVFHHPLEVAPELAEVPTPEDFPYHSIDDWGPTMKIWKTQTVNYPYADVGMCHTLYGFEDSPDAEMFARGIGMKGPDCVALSRQANYFHWGFSVPPSQMTESARRLFVNAICYIRKFDGAHPLIRQVSMPREWADGIRVDMTGKYVMLLIPAEGEKGGQDRVYPVTPDFAELLRSVPPAERTGMVFNPVLHRGPCHRIDTVSKLVSQLGEAANIKVDEKPAKEKGKPATTVWASAHDLRRAFGARWSRKVNSMVLKELMRHASVTTTEKYYVGINADETAALLAGLMPSSTSEVVVEVVVDKKRPSDRSESL